MQKLYAYIDESGQDTAGRIFIVAAVVITNSDAKNDLFRLCEALEQLSGKGNAKWKKAKSGRRLEYLRRVFTEKRFHGRLRYAVFSNSSEYDLATIKGIAKVIQWEQPPDTTNIILVDGLSKTKRQEYAQELRKLGIRIYKIRGVAKDENDALIRLADALAGFIRDVLDEKSPDGREMFERARSSGVLVEV